MSLQAVASVLDGVKHHGSNGIGYPDFIDIMSRDSHDLAGDDASNSSATSAYNIALMARAYRCTSVQLCCPCSPESYRDTPTILGNRQDRAFVSHKTLSCTCSCLVCNKAGDPQSCIKFLKALCVVRVQRYITLRIVWSGNNGGNCQGPWQTLSGRF